MGAVHPAVPALVCETAREKGIPVSVRGEVTGDPEAVPKPVEAGASLSMEPLSVLKIEKLVGEL
jgi:phosphoenolpyruvate-protein kinase (PTS system EI component)